MEVGLIASATAGGGEAAAQDQLKVAAVFETPIDEPWVNQIHVALLQAKVELGIEYTWSESVSASDFARVLRGCAEQDHGLIMGDSFGTERITRRVARDYPEVAFAFGSGIGPAEPNFAVFDTGSLAGGRGGPAVRRPRGARPAAAVERRHRRALSGVPDAAFRRDDRGDGVPGAQGPRPGRAARTLPPRGTVMTGVLCRIAEIGAKSPRQRSDARLRGSRRHGA